MKIERSHVLWALKRSVTRGAMMYLLVVGLGLVRSIDTTTWIAGLAFAFLVHVIVFGVELWRIRRHAQPPPRSPDR